MTTWYIWKIVTVSLPFYFAPFVLFLLAMLSVFIVIICTKEEKWILCVFIIWHVIIIVFSIIISIIDLECPDFNENTLYFDHSLKQDYYTSVSDFGGWEK